MQELITPGQKPKARVRHRRADLDAPTNVTVQTNSGADVTLIGGRSLTLGVALDMAKTLISSGVSASDAVGQAPALARRLIEACPVTAVTGRPVEVDV